MSELPFTITKALLRSGCQLTPNDAAVTRKSSGRGGRRLQALEDEISRLRHLSRDLSLKKQALTTFVDHHLQMLSPSYRLPSDVLQEIFFHCLPATHNAVVSIWEPPLSLGLVCRRWREVVYTTPKLWTSIHIVATPLSPERDIARRQVVSSWLSRSGILPLSISIYMDVKRRRVPVQAMSHPIHPDIDIIIRHAHRWKSLNSQVLDYDWSIILAQLTSHDVPLLEQLCIDNLNPYRARDWGPDPSKTLNAADLCRGYDIFQASRLRSLALPRSLAVQLEARLRWERLTGLELRLSYLLMSNVAQILLKCYKLQNLTLAVSSELDSWSYLWPPPLPITPRRLNLATLQTLTLISDFNQNETFFHIFEFLSTPALRHLSYQRQDTGQNIPWDIRSQPPTETQLVGVLREFLDRLVDPLVELDIQIDIIPEKTLLDILRSTPAVRRLSLRGELTTQFPSPISYGFFDPSPARHPLNDSLLRHFIADPQENRSDAVVPAVEDKEEFRGLCPKLEVLSLSMATFSRKAILEFIRSRSVRHKQNNVTCLRKLEIKFLLTASDLQNREQLILEQQEIQRELLELGKETEMQIALHYPNLPSSSLTPGLVPAPTYTPHEGLWRTDNQNSGPFYFY
ncbi:hypothetical protein AN958_03279 [Leucoagaricus sp. SymC.cos]|nr:hypothetical protein AN958_03279 [Leucoagaricus sp. SymC.cos]